MRWFAKPACVAGTVEEGRRDPAAGDLARLEGKSDLYFNGAGSPRRRWAYDAEARRR
jgi:hypothetical protein